MGMDRKGGRCSQERCEEQGETRGYYDLYDDSI